MVNVILGHNATGKTLFLNNLLKDNQKAVTNLIQPVFFSETKFNSEAVNRIERALGISDITKRGTSINYVSNDGVELSSEMCDLLFLLCCDMDVAILDEPDFGMTEVERGKLITVFSYLSTIFLEIWITTHDEGMLYLDNANYYRVERMHGSSNVRLISLSRENCYEYII